jgi:DNA-binding NtrC family response regulator
MTDPRSSTRILVVDDEEIVRESLSAWLRKDGYSVETAPEGSSALARLEAEPFALMIVDLKMPGIDGLEVLAKAHARHPETTVVVMTAYATIDTAVSAMKDGAWDYLVKPFDPEELSNMVHRIVAQQTLARENALLRRIVRREYRFRDLVSKSPAMQAVFDLARTAARSSSTILVLGESGTGKELLARAIHAESPWHAGPFVAVSCAALTETLLESELFGYEKGAFTGAAAQRRGKFEVANGGTLFLDEIGDIGSKLQMDLLRVLEERQLFRVGGNQAVRVDVRIVAATNRDLRREVREGRFREDLFYRLNVIAITLPPLRERKEDLPLLVQHFMERLAAETGKHGDGLSADAQRRLMEHAWPGNVRELRNVLERALVVSKGPLIEPTDLGLDAGPSGAVSETPTVKLSLEDVERSHISAVLASTHGNVSQAARVLGIDRATLYAKMHKYGLRREADAEPSAEEPKA